ncbi:hypothetical protein [Streptomyces griseorubiginosus]|uniref:hypothetical protein n=1 Tax=Streptomyces griseorubiginosus TaxID=67304 RepID=UPI00332D2E64
MLTNFRNMTLRQKLAIIPAAALGYGIYTAISYLVLWILTENGQVNAGTVRVATVIGMLIGAVYLPRINRIITGLANRIGGRQNAPTA